MVGSLNDWQKERQFQSLNEKKEERGVKVIRGGVEQVVDIHKIVVGDVADEASQAHAYSVLGLASTLGSILGPAVGSVI